MPPGGRFDLSNGKYGLDVDGHFNQSCFTANNRRYPVASRNHREKSNGPQGVSHFNTDK